VADVQVETPTHLPDAHTDRLVHSTFALLISNGAGVVLGFGFWFVAARIYNVTDVGKGAVEVNAMTFLAAFGLLNLGTIFPRFLYAAGAKAGRVLRVGYAASTSVALVVSVIFLLVTVGHRNYMEPGLGPSVIFVAAVVLWVVFTIEDAALVGFRRTFWVPVENGSFSIAKIALLPVFVIVAPHAGVFTSWVLPVILCTAAINFYLWRRVLPEHVLRANGAGIIPERRVVGTVFAGEYVGGLAFTAMATLPSLIIAARLGQQEAGYFQTPWIAGTSFDGLLFSFATSLIVEATARPSTAAATVRRSVRLAAWILVPSVLVILIGAPWFLEILGSGYASHGTRLLQCLALALPFMAVNVLYVTYARLARRVRRVLFVQLTIASIVLSLSIVLIGSRLGITGVGVAFLIGQGLVALVLLPSVVRQYRHPEMTPGFAGGATLVVRSTAGPPSPRGASAAARSSRRSGSSPRAAAPIPSAAPLAVAPVAAAPLEPPTAASTSPRATTGAAPNGAAASGDKASGDAASDAATSGDAARASVASPPDAAGTVPSVWRRRSTPTDGDAT
jgi:O-antigen/teichoic acid export membrane protein